MKIYQIVLNEWNDEFGKVRHTNYQIRYKKRKFFGLISYWSYVTHSVADMSGRYDTRTEFSSEEDARDYINNVLCKNLKTTEWVKTPISEYTCCYTLPFTLPCIPMYS